MNLDFRHVTVLPRPLAFMLGEIEAAQLVRRAGAPETGEPAYIFKHALVQDSAYQSLMRTERKRLHQLVGDTLARDTAGTAGENAALLAYHFEQAEDWPRALEYLQRAAEQARRGAAHREELALLARALQATEHVGGLSPAARAALLARRGQAFASITEWDEAERELTAALDLLPATDLAARAQSLLDLSIVQGWLRKLAEGRRAAHEARILAEQAGRQDLVANALSVLAMSEAVSGDVRASVTDFDQAFERAGELRSSSLVQSMEMSGLAQYWLGDYTAALDRNREAVRRARELGDSVTIMRGLSNIGMSLVASGHYAEAFSAFAEARAFGETHALGAWLARQIAIEGGLHLDLFDFAGAQALALEAQARARASRFIVAMVSPGVDLLFNFARTGHLQHAAAIEAEIRQALPSVTGPHLWLLGLRFAQAQAELAAARLDWPAALELAGRSLELSRRHGRVKYQVAALGTRARALAGLARPADPLETARAAVSLAGANADPALFVRAALGALALQDDPTLRSSARAAAHRITRSLPDAQLADRFSSYLADLL